MYISCDEEKHSRRTVLARNSQQSYKIVETMFEDDNDRMEESHIGDDKAKRYSYLIAQKKIASKVLQIFFQR